jgi:hypothetical protein
MFFITQRFNVGLKTLVPKLRNHGFIINYRPMSVLGSTYKITSKVLVCKVQFSLPLWIKLPKQDL